MAIKAYNPTTNGRRGMTSQDFSDVTTKKPLKSLVRIKKSTAGRNNQGRITTRHRGGGVRRMYRLMNHQLAAGMSAVVEHIEYDPNRSARIARIKDQHGLYHYILASRDMKIGTTGCHWQTSLLVLRFMVLRLTQARAAKWSVQPIQKHN